MRGCCPALGGGKRHLSIAPFVLQRPDEHERQAGQQGRHKQLTKGSGV